jgi:adenylate cyclase
MELFSGVADWISGHETLLSGMAALIVLGGVALTVLSAGWQRVLGLRAREPRADAPGAIDPAAPTASAPPRTGDKPSLAVLPFTNLSDSSEQDFLADGMTEDLIMGLSANRHLSVVARNSTFAYKGRATDIRTVGRELGVRYVLEGSVRRVGERLRTAAQLIEAETGAHLWAEKYDRPYAEMFAVQDELVSSIAGALNAQLSSAEYARARRGKPSELGAWERVQRAIFGTFYSMTGEQVCASIAELREAVALDPDYAYAHSALAWMLYLSIINGWSDDIEAARNEARPHLKAALEGGSDDPLTLFYAGASYLYSGRFERAIRVLESSLARNPHQPDVHMHLGLACGYLGRFAEAHQHFARAEQLASSGGMSRAYGWYRSHVLGFEGRYQEAVALLEDFLARSSRYPSPRIWLALYLDALGRHAEARAVIERTVRENPQLNLEGMALMAAAHADPEQGRARAARLREYWPRG